MAYLIIFHEVFNCLKSLQLIPTSIYLVYEFIKRTKFLIKIITTFILTNAIYQQMRGYNECLIVISKFTFLFTNSFFFIAYQFRD